MLIIVETKKLKPTEEIVSSRLPEVEKALGLNPKKWPPVMVSSEDFLLDGHHRRAIAMKYGFEHLNALKLDYADEGLEVFDYQTGETLDKNTLLTIYKSGVVLKPKTTRHILNK